MPSPTKDGATEEEVLLTEIDCSSADNVNDVLDSMFSAIDAEDLKALGSSVDEWKTLVADESLPFELWAELALANPIARAVTRTKEKVVEFLASDEELRLDAPCASSCQCRLCVALSRDLRLLQLYSQDVLVPLASWSYVRVAFADDPVTSIIHVWRAVRESAYFRSSATDELKKDLHRRLEETMVHCLGTTITEDEVVALLGAPSPFISITNLIKANMQRAVAHPAVQGILQRGWRNGGDSLPCFGHDLPSVFRALSFVFVYLVLVPISVLVPHPRLIRYIRCPEVVYTNEAVAYWIFLLFVASSFSNEGLNNHYIICQGSPRFHHYLLAAVIFARLVRNCDGLWHFGMEYFTSGYEIVQCLSGIFYAFGITLLIIATHVVPQKEDVIMVCTKLAFHLASDKNITRETAMKMMFARPVTQCQALADFQSMGMQYASLVNAAIEPHNLSSFFFAIGHLLYYLSAGQVLYMSRLVGHLNIAVTQMITDVARWAFVMVLFFMAWSLAMVSLYKNYSCENRTFSTMQSSFMEMFWVLFAMTGTDDYKMKGKLKKYDHRSVILIEYTGFVVYASYYILAQIVLVNLLIALMSVTFQNIEDDRLTSLAYWRSKIRVKFILWNTASSIPTPFNILYPIFWVTNGIRRYFSRSNVLETKRYQFQHVTQKRKIQLMLSRNRRNKIRS